MRQNKIFKDFFELAESDINKRKYLYVIGDTAPLKFFRGGRALTNVLVDTQLFTMKLKINMVQIL